MYPTNFTDISYISLKRRFLWFSPLLLVWSSLLGLGLWEYYGICGDKEAFLDIRSWQIMIYIVIMKLLSFLALGFYVARNGLSMYTASMSYWITYAQFVFVSIPASVIYFVVGKDFRDNYIIAEFELLFIYCWYFVLFDRFLSRCIKRNPPPLNQDAQPRYGTSAEYTAPLSSPKGTSGSPASLARRAIEAQNNSEGRDPILNV